MDFGELQGLYAKKFQEGNSGPNAYTGKKSQSNGKRYKENTQFQYFCGNIFLHGFIFTHDLSPHLTKSAPHISSGGKIKNRGTAYHFIKKNPLQISCRSFPNCRFIYRPVSQWIPPVGPGFSILLQLQTPAPSCSSPG